MHKNEIDKKKYAKNAGICPYCGSDNLIEDIESPYLERNSVYTKNSVYCKECTGQWEEIYKLDSVRKLIK